MMEYTLAVLIGLVIVFFIDHFLKTRVLRVQNKPFWFSAGIFGLFQLVFDNVFTWQGIWVFNRVETIGLFVPFIPVENLLFGFELFSFTIILYEFFRRARGD